MSNSKLKTKPTSTLSPNGKKRKLKNIEIVSRSETASTDTITSLLNDIEACITNIQLSNQAPHQIVLQESPSILCLFLFILRISGCSSAYLKTLPTHLLPHTAAHDPKKITSILQTTFSQKTKDVFEPALISTIKHKNSDILQSFCLLFSNTHTQLLEGSQAQNNTDHLLLCYASLAAMNLRFFRYSAVIATVSLLRILLSKLSITPCTWLPDAIRLIFDAILTKRACDVFTDTRLKTLEAIIWFVESQNYIPAEHLQLQLYVRHVFKGLNDSSSAVRVRALRFCHDYFRTEGQPLLKAHVVKKYGDAFVKSLACAAAPKEEKKYACKCLQLLFKQGLYAPGDVEAIFSAAGCGQAAALFFDYIGKKTLLFTINPPADKTIRRALKTLFGDCAYMDKEAVALLVCIVDTATNLDLDENALHEILVKKYIKTITNYRLLLALLFCSDETGLFASAPKARMLILFFICSLFSLKEAQDVELECAVALLSHLDRLLVHLRSCNVLLERLLATVGALPFFKISVCNEECFNRGCDVLVDIFTTCECEAVMDGVVRFIQKAQSSNFIYASHTVSVVQKISDALSHQLAAAPSKPGLKRAASFLKAFSWEGFDLDVVKTAIRNDASAFDAHLLLFRHIVRTEVCGCEEKRQCVRGVLVPQFLSLVLDSLLACTRNGDARCCAVLFCIVSDFLIFCCNTSMVVNDDSAHAPVVIGALGLVIRNEAVHANNGEVDIAKVVTASVRMLLHCVLPPSAPVIALFLYALLLDNAFVEELVMVALKTMIKRNMLVCSVFVESFAGLFFGNDCFCKCVGKLRGERLQRVGGHYDLFLQLVARSEADTVRVDGLHRQVGENGLVARLGPLMAHMTTEMSVEFASKYAPGVRKASPAYAKALEKRAKRKNCVKKMEEVDEAGSNDNDSVYMFSELEKENANVANVKSDIVNKDFGATDDRPAVVVGLECENDDLFLFPLSQDK